MTIAKLRSVEQLGAQPEQQGFFPPGQVIEPGGVYRPPEPSPPQSDQGAGLPPISGPDPAPQLQPIDLYKTMLKYLKELAESDSPFKDLTLGEAFQLAKDNKGIVIQAIETE